MDLPIKHEAFAGRGLALRTAGFFKGPRLIIDGGEVKAPKPSSWPGRWLGTNTCGWRSLSPLSSSAAAWVHCSVWSPSTRAPGSFEAIVARPPSTV